MANLWYYQQGDQRMGPVPAEALKSLVVAGLIQPTDMVMRDDMTTWVAASQVRGLFGPAATAPAAAVPHGTPAAHPVAYENAPATQPNRGTRKSSFSSAQKNRRILLIVVAAIVVICFFTPEFYKSITLPKSSGPGMSFMDPRTGVRTPNNASTSNTYWIFGWDTWWGLVTLIVGFKALGVAIADLATGCFPIMRKIFKWFHLSFFSILTLVALAGTILGLFNMGLIDDPAETARNIVSAFGGSSMGADTKLATTCIPITAALLVVAAVMGTIVSLLIVTKDKE